MKKCLQYFNLLWNVLWSFSLNQRQPLVDLSARSSQNSFWSSKIDALLFRPSDVLPSISNRALDIASSVVCIDLRHTFWSGSNLPVVWQFSKCLLPSWNEVKYVPQSHPEWWIIRPTKLAAIQYSVIFPALFVHRFHQNRLDPFLILQAVVSFHIRRYGYFFPGWNFHWRQYFYKHTRKTQREGKPIFVYLFSSPSGCPALQVSVAESKMGLRKIHEIWASYYFK